MISIWRSTFLFCVFSMISTYAQVDKPVTLSKFPSKNKQFAKIPISLEYNVQVDSSGNETRVYPITASYGKWREIGPVNTPEGPGPIRLRGTGRLVFIEFDETHNRIFTGSPVGGLWYTENEGQNWQNGGTDFLPEIGVSHMQIATNENNGETWFIVTGDGEGAFNASNGIWRTTDKGRNWHPINHNNSLGIGNQFPPFFWSRCRKILIHPTDGNILYAAFAHGLYRTKNALAKYPGAVVWERVADNTLMNRFFDICFKPETNGETVVVSGDKVAISRDNGEKGSFSLLYNQEQIGKKDNKKLISLRFALSNPDKLYGASEGCLFSYDFKNGAVKNRKVGSFYQRHQALAVSLTNENEMLIGNVNPIYKSTDGGGTFTSKPPKKRLFHDDQHWIEYRQNGEIWLANDGGIYKSEDGGDTWTNLTNGLGVATYYNIGTSERLPDLIIGGGWDTGPNFYDAEYGSFRVMNAFGDAFESVIDDTDPENPIYYVSLQGGVMRFNNNLKQAIFSGKPSRKIKGSRNWVHSFVKDHQNQKVLYYAGGEYIGRTTDGAYNWQIISENAKKENKFRYYNQVWNVAGHSNVLYAQLMSKQKGDEEGFKLLKTTNALDSAGLVKWETIDDELKEWYAKNSEVQPEISDIAIDPENPNRIWVSIPTYDIDLPKVWYYDGKNWEGLSNDGIEDMRINSIVYQANSKDRLYIGTHAGVFQSLSGAKPWSKLVGLPHANVSELEINHCAGLLRACTFGRGIWEMDLLAPIEEVAVSTDLVWTKEKAINTSITIYDGASLTLKSTLNMGFNTQIYVQKGGRLIIDGGTITNYCQREWDGIRVEGQINPIINFDLIPQVEILNNGQILKVKASP